MPIKDLVVQLDGSRDAPARLDDALDLGVELLVMGCYGHSRLRERVLGGVTREILETMTVPVVMSH
jgi:nucleotide-binding universal stress UspA family protein